MYSSATEQYLHFLYLELYPTSLFRLQQLLSKRVQSKRLFRVS